MYSFDELNKMTKDKIKEMAEEQGIEITSAMKKLDIINKITEENREKKSKRPDNVQLMTGVLEVKPDGYGFLRF